MTDHVVSIQPIKLTLLLSFLLSLQRNQVQSGSELKRSLPTPGRRACRLGWGCQGSGPGTPFLSGSRWPCSCKWQLRSPSTVQVRAYHGGHVLCGRVAEEDREGALCWMRVRACRALPCVCCRWIKVVLKGEGDGADCFCFFLFLALHLESSYTS